MEILYMLVPLAILLGLTGLVALIWAIRHGQFEDMEGPAHRILFEDDQSLVPVQPPPSTAESPPADHNSAGPPA
ncbi:MAG: cbb3-type cytochrome oxidase assembly protein CcoS [Magnetococcales bacterium]|nr:cbb3-type cytochrome oxidase assembly protein CcoS [Magnetococcales bacterium]